MTRYSGGCQCLFNTRLFIACNRYDTIGLTVTRGVGNMNHQGGIAMVCQ